MHITLRRTILILLMSLLAMPPAAAAATTDADAASTAAAETSATQRLSLPEPTGPVPVGSRTLHLVDTSRTDPWVPSAGHRQLMVSMHYPTMRRRGEPSQYSTAAESEAFIDFQRRQGAPIPDDFPGDVLRTVQTNALADAPPLPAFGGRPLIVLSPGFGLSRSSLTGLATELASRGYVVAAIDHVYESFGIELPDGELTECAACEEHASAVPPVRSEDVSFVLDELLGHQSPWRFSWMIDRDRIGMAGHSIGGNAASTAMSNDDRIGAGVNMDGTFFTPARPMPERPFMMLGTADMHAPNGDDPTWDRAWRKLGGPRYWLTIEGSDHFSFADYPRFIEQLGLEEPDAPLTGTRALQVTRAYVGAFFDEHLRGRSQELLDGPSPRYEEVDFHQP